MARLPTPGSDNEIWGDVLNQFLRVELNNDGTLRRGTELSQAVSDAASAKTTADSIVSARGQADGYAPLAANSLVPPANIANGSASSTTYLRGDQNWSPLPSATTGSAGTVQLAGDLAGTATLPTVPGLAAKANSTDVTAISNRVTSLEGISVNSIGTDAAFFGDIFSSVERRSCNTQETLSIGYETFSGGVSPRTFTANSLRFHVRAIAPAGRAITFAIYTGTNRTNLAKQAEMTVTSSLLTTGSKEVALSSAVSIARGDFVYLGMLATGSGSPDPALSTTTPVASDLLNPVPGTIMTAYRSSRSSLPVTLNVNSGYTADGRIFWFALI